MTDASPITTIISFLFFFQRQNLLESTFFRKVLYSHKIQAAMSHQRKHITNYIIIIIIIIIIIMKL